MEKYAESLPEGEPINMERELELQRKYGGEAICGYVRNPHTNNDAVRGRCSLENCVCMRSLPMDMENCAVYQRRFRK